MRNPDQADDIVEEKDDEPVKSDPPKDDKKPDKKPKKKKDDDKKKKGKEFSLGDDWEGDSNAQMAFAGFCAAIIGALLLGMSILSITLKILKVSMRNIQLYPSVCPPTDCPFGKILTLLSSNVKKSHF